MNSNSLTLQDIGELSYCGVLRGFIVDAITHPIEVTKLKLQSTNESPIKIFDIIKKTLAQDGISGLYDNNFKFRLVTTPIKQFWYWPMIVCVPETLQSYGFSNLQQQITTGLIASTIDTAITVPLERAKITASVFQRILFALQTISTDRWQGYGAYWAKRSVTAITFLITQKHLREECRINNEPLPIPKSISIGAEIGILIGLVSAPFDFANTIKQQQKANNPLLSSSLRILYTGAPLNALTLTIHGIFSIIILEYARNSRETNKTTRLK